MSKNIIIPVVIFIVIAICSILYFNNTKALNSAYYYISNISLENYTFRGMANQNSKISLKNKIAKTDILFSKDPIKAITSYESLLKEDPGNSSIHMRLGMSYLKIEQLDPAKEHLYFVYEDNDSGLQPDSAWFLALLFLSEYNKTEAKKMLKECIEKKCSYKKEAALLSSKI